MQWSNYNLRKQKKEIFAVRCQKKRKRQKSLTSTSRCCTMYSCHDILHMRNRFTTTAIVPFVIGVVVFHFLRYLQLCCNLSIFSQYRPREQVCFPALVTLVCFNIARITLRTSDEEGFVKSDSPRNIWPANYSKLLLLQVSSCARRTSDAFFLL